MADDGDGDDDKGFSISNDSRKNVRVACRFRPTNRVEKEAGAVDCVSFKDNGRIIVEVFDEYGSSTQGKYPRHNFLNRLHEQTTTTLTDINVHQIN